MEENKKSSISDEEITINLSDSRMEEETKTTGKRTARRATKKKTTRLGKKDKKDNNGKKKWSKKKILITILIVIVALIAIAGAVFARYVYKAEGDVTQAVKNMASDVAVNIVGNDEPIFVLILGISEDITSKLTDTIMLAGYNPESQKAFIISIPRDTFIGTNEDKASGWDKINALYQKDINKTIKSVEELTGVNIDNYVIVRNTMLSALVDAIGEVEFDVPIDMDYDDPTQDLHIHLSAGVQMIDRDEAEQLLRFRHNNDGSSYPSSWGDNDYGRMRTQREFIKVVAKQLISLNNVTKLKAIAEAVFANLETNMSVSDVIGYIPYGINFNVDELRMEQLPGSGAMLNSLSFYKASYSKSKTLMNELIEYLELDDTETSKYYNGKIKQTVSSSNSSNDKDDECTHNYSSSITKEATCASTGIRTYTCTLCGSSYTETIATTSNHNYNSNGKCTVCGIEKTTSSHECSYTILKDTIIEANCTENGTGTYACSICGNKANLTIKAKGHSYGSDGKCTRCGASLGNSSGGNTSGDNTNTVPHEHSYTSSITTSPTCENTGVRTYTCYCGYSYTETIPKIGHKFDPSSPTCLNGCGKENTDYNAPTTPPEEPEVPTTPDNTTPDTSV